MNYNWRIKAAGKQGSEDLTGDHLEIYWVSSEQNLFDFYGAVKVELVFKQDSRYRYSWNPIGHKSILIMGVCVVWL